MSTHNLGGNMSPITSGPSLGQTKIRKFGIEFLHPQYIMSAGNMCEFNDKSNKKFY